MSEIPTIKAHLASVKHGATLVHQQLSSGQPMDADDLLETFRHIYSAIELLSDMVEEKLGR